MIRSQQLNLRHQDRRISKNYSLLPLSWFFASTDRARSRLTANNARNFFNIPIGSLHRCRKSKFIVSVLSGLSKIFHATFIDRFIQRSITRTIVPSPVIKFRTRLYRLTFLHTPICIYSSGCVFAASIAILASFVPWSINDLFIANKRFDKLLQRCFPLTSTF